jgi:hypothetical protein
MALKKSGSPLFFLWEGKQAAFPETITFPCRFNQVSGKRDKSQNSLVFGA